LEGFALAPARVSDETGLPFVSATRAYGGKYSLAIPVRTTTAKSGAVWLRAAMCPGGHALGGTGAATFSFQFFLDGPAIDQSVSVGGYLFTEDANGMSSEGNGGFSMVPGRTNSGSWVSFTDHFYAGDGAELGTFVLITISFPGNWTGTIYLDDVTIKRN
jgi:hypothetical protein